MIAVPDPSMMKNVCGLVPSALLTNNELDHMIQDLSEEINHDYEYSIRKSIGEKCDEEGCLEIGIYLMDF
ncbi:hypothetical protein DPMN_030186 [Dreissena polymorpha]|uniref:Uncharacterized protein n=1 Tax=Dreissena polymorpha TaxID=45954 RepID=A0A9D4RFY0_DREPO|nr:hypothetical protein DPMN_030186 [Dreissena polymorpha]